jgi:hypothetical protein
MPAPRLHSTGSRRPRRTASWARAGAHRNVAGTGHDAAIRDSIFCTGFSRAQRYGKRVFRPKVAVMDAIYLLLLAALYLVTHGLVWALSRIGQFP